MPKGLHNVYTFDFFNTTSWIVVLGAPMLLFLQHLEATATVLAIAASLSPLLVILQIPAAAYVERVGYRRFVLSGWTSRSFFVVGMAVVAFLPDSVDRTTKIALMLFLSFIYNTLRGISSCGLLPWFTHIVPEERRGEFLAKDQSAVAISGIISLLFYGLLFRGNHAWYSFGIVFAISAAAAFVSLTFLKRVPDVEVEKIVLNPNPLPWKEMLFYPPFLHYLRFNVVINMALGASGVFWVRYFRLFLHVTESNILLFNCTMTIVLAITLFLVTSLIDRAGNKPVLMLSCVFIALHFAIWAFLAAGVLPYGYSIFFVQASTAGIGVALWNISNVRAVMSIVPAMGRAHFLALYSVFSSLTLGIVPLIWGPILDSLDRWHVSWWFWQWNSYSIFYSALVVNMLVGLAYLRALTEPMKMTWDVFVRELLIETPSRAISRLIPRSRSTNN